MLNREYLYVIDLASVNSTRKYIGSQERDKFVARRRKRKKERAQRKLK